MLACWMFGVTPMKAAIDRVMATYGMLKKLTPAEERELRRVVSCYVQDLSAEDETRVVIKALRYLRGLEGIS
jgi:hypothetical protein